MDAMTPITPAEQLAHLAAPFTAASDDLLRQVAESALSHRDHAHPAEGTGPDLYCLNLTSYMGNTMGAVLRRVADLLGQVDELRELVARIDAGDDPRPMTNVAIPGERSRRAEYVWPDPDARQSY